MSDSNIGNLARWSPAVYHSGRLYGAQHKIDHYFLAEHPEALRYAAQSLQDRVGRGLVQQIWDAGGIATIALDFRCPPAIDDLDRAQRLYLESLIVPAEAMNIPVRVEVKHFEYFPMDWVCDHCGRLVDGLKYARVCPHCAGGKPEKYW